MKFLIMTDIEGVTGVTTYQQAENSQFGRDMLMNDLLAVIDGIRADGPHDIVVYDMHTDGRNIDISQLPEDVSVVMGKPINGKLWRGVGKGFDGLFMVGLHAMSKEPGAMLAHSYLREYDAIYINEDLVGEIGVECLLAGEQGTPLVFVSGDDKGCKEAEQFAPGVITVAVKHSLDEAQALCLPPTKTSKLLKAAAARAASNAAKMEPKIPDMPVTITVKYSDCKYLQIMKEIHQEIFMDDNTAVMKGENLLETWSEYLLLEKEMTTK